MYIISDFKFQLNKTKIINAVKSYCQTPPYEELSKIYDDLLPMLREISKPIGIFKIDNQNEELNSTVINKCSHIVYSLVTIGEGSVKKVDNFFEEGKFYEAVLLDAMASSYLFNVSSELFNSIYKTTKDMNLGLTCKIAPGDGEIDLEYQKNIVNKFNNEDIHGISVIDKYMLYPSKSMSYVYGADASIAFNRKDHSCANCYNTFCTMRDTSGSIKGPFLKESNCA
ncbi:5-methyltetrahydrofolate--homocysteine methyltransferase [Clostridium sp. P21]|uniref:5-methyltetrahydrofolate--homocysteine methyltransferase n=1 Tax=Clostridium muellerianum TaxID=2716538 RepID=A0A7Y0HPG2_9CLOT|nr:5-methyltetrahydrofolate--homocysteine methyltransferase [Clostridium muellerianum]NMM63001.1 5-methyltetrahydrofolate--homocysteine methyltransferase [Clostridium muellerianum]